MSFLSKITNSTTFLSLAFGFTLVSIPLYINLYPSKTAYEITPGKTITIENNQSQCPIYYKLNVNCNLIKEPDNSQSVFANFSGLFDGINFYIVYLKDTLEIAHFQFIDNGTFSYQVPSQAKLLVQCDTTKGLTGKAAVTVEQREVLQPKTYAFVPNYSDTNKIPIKPGTENLVYNNNTNGTCLIQFFVINNFKFVDDAWLSIFPESISCFITSPFEKKDVIKTRKRLSFIDSGQEETLTYILPPGFSLYLNNNNPKTTGNAYFQRKALAF